MRLNILKSLTENLKCLNLNGIRNPVTESQKHSQRPTILKKLT